MVRLSAHEEASAPRHAGRFLAALVGLLLLSVPLPAFAQLTPPAPVRAVVDENHIDLLSGQVTLTEAAISVGDSSNGGLTYSRTVAGFGSIYDSYDGSMGASGSTYSVAVGASTERFTLASGVFTPNSASGSTLAVQSGSSDHYVYTTADGTQYVFYWTRRGMDPLGGTLMMGGILESATRPNGEVLTFHYGNGTFCSIVEDPCSDGYNYAAWRVESVNNNLGYQIKVDYGTNSAPTAANLASWLFPSKVTLLNNAVDYCPTSSTACSGLTVTWPSLTFSAVTASPQTITDALGRVTRVNTSSGFSLRTPAQSSDNYVVAFSGSPSRVSSVTTPAGTWTYTYSDSSGSRTTTVTDPLTHSRVVVSNIANGTVTTDTDALGHTTSYQYDSNNRMTRITRPEGNYSEISYDGRGNVTAVTEHPKSGSGLSNIVSSASYPSSCSNPVTCNRPDSVTDALGNTTEFTYDSTHGGILSVTGPAPSSGADRPQTRFSYASGYSWYKNSGGSIVQAASPVYRLTQTSSCVSGSTCTGNSPSEVRTTLDYGTGSSSAANNRIPLSVTVAAGDGSPSATSSFTYDGVGNVLTVDGPLSGTGDIVRNRFDADRELVGMVGPDPDGDGSQTGTPDPDGNGARIPQAVRTTYNDDGLVTLTEHGTVASQSDSDWSSTFTTFERRATSYDAAGRPIQRTLSGGSGPTTYAVTQYSYDSAGRLDCTAVRMNPSVFGSLPSSACTLGTTGSNGADRITRNTYTNADQVSTVTVAYGTSAAVAAATATYTNNGLQTTLADGRGSLTTYEYDSFDRLSKIRYPNPSSSGSSTSDYEQFTYDAASRITTLRRRDGNNIGYSYDHIGRLVGLDLPGSDPDPTYTYDLLNRQLTATASSRTITLGWDGLGRLISQADSLSGMGTMSYQYDLAGDRTRVTWPDTFYVTYDYDATGSVVYVRENGAGSGVGLLATYSYDNLGRRTGLTRGNSSTSTFGYDDVGRLSSLGQNLSGTSDDVTLDFTYSASSQILTRTVSDSDYVYHPSAASSTYAVNNLNQYTSVGGASYSYDTRGNLTGDGTRTLAYDSVNRLTSVSAPTAVTLAYDPFSRLASSTVSSTETRFLYDGDTMAAELNTSGTVLRRYVDGPGQDETLVWYEGSGTASRHWLHADNQGSVIAYSNDSGTSGATYGFGPYGEPNTWSTSASRMKFTGQPAVPEGNVYYYRARFYDPVLGRFLQADPLGQQSGMNLYSYVSDDPGNLIDATGLFTVCPGAECPGWTTEVSGTVITAARCINCVDYSALGQILPPITIGLGLPLVNAAPTVTFTQQQLAEHDRCTAVTARVQAGVGNVRPMPEWRWNSVEALAFDIDTNEREMATALPFHRAALALELAGATATVGGAVARFGAGNTTNVVSAGAQRVGSFAAGEFAEFGSAAGFVGAWATLSIIAVNHTYEQQERETPVLRDRLAMAGCPGGPH